MTVTAVLPRPRGDLSDRVVDALLGGGPVGDLSRAHAAARRLDREPDVVGCGDLQLALWTLYELHYRGFAGVDERLEWDPELLRLRGRLEATYERHLREATRDFVATVVQSEDELAETLFAGVEAYPFPPLSSFLQRRATPDQMREFLVTRSLYQLKEADPHSWVIPRLDGAVKVALVEVQYDEYGSGRPQRLHASMFAQTMLACGLDPSYARHVDAVPAVTLAVSNLVSLFGLNRRLRGAALGHLGAFEATSSVPSRKVAGGLRRLGFGDEAAAYYDEHVEADSVHEQVAMRDICEGLVRQSPELLEDVAFGAGACLYVDAAAASYLLSRWTQGESVLRPLGDPSVTAVGA